MTGLPERMWLLVGGGRTRQYLNVRNAFPRAAPARLAEKCQQQLLDHLPLLAILLLHGRDPVENGPMVLFHRREALGERSILILKRFQPVREIGAGVLVLALEQSDAGCQVRAPRE